MIYSAIKSIIRNNTDRKFNTPINSRLRIVITPKGEAGDSAIISGDVFTLIDRTTAMEALVNAILDERISLEYVIDKIVSVTPNEAEPNLNSCVAIRDAVAKLNGGLKAIEKENIPVVPVVEKQPEDDVKQLEPTEPSTATVEEAKQTEDEVKPSEPVESPKPTEPAIETAAVTDSQVVDTLEKSQNTDEPKKTKRPRQIKVN